MEHDNTSPAKPDASSAPALPDTLALISLCEQHLKTGNLKEVNDLSKQFEDLHLTSEDEFAAACAVLRCVKQATSEMIVVRRFLATHPKSITARMHLVKLRATYRTERSDLEPLADELLLDKQHLNATQLLGLGEVFRAWRRNEAALDVYIYLADREPTNVEAQRRIVRLLSDLRDTSGAMRAMARLVDITPVQADWLAVTVIEAARIGEKKLLGLCLAKLRPFLNQTKADVLEQTIQALIVGGFRKQTEELCLDLDYALMNDPEALRRLGNIMREGALNWAAILTFQRLVQLEPDPATIDTLHGLERFLQAYGSLSMPRQSAYSRWISLFTARWRTGKT